MLALFGIIAWGMPLEEIVGKIAIQTVPASIGAIVASKQFHAADEGARRRGGDEEARRAMGASCF